MWIRKLFLSVAFLLACLSSPAWSQDDNLSPILVERFEYSEEFFSDVYWQQDRTRPDRYLPNTQFRGSIQLYNLADKDLNNLRVEVLMRSATPERLTYFAHREQVPKLRSHRVFNTRFETAFPDSRIRLYPALLITGIDPDGYSFEVVVDQPIRSSGTQKERRRARDAYEKARKEWLQSLEDD